MSLVSGVTALATRVALECSAIWTALAGKADDSAVVHTTGTETINGAKTFGTAPNVPVGSLLTHPVRRDDARLTDARTPTSHNHAGADINSGTVAYARLPIGTAASTVAAGDDSRITGAVQTSRTVTGTGALTGGGDLSANRTLDVGTGTITGTHIAAAVKDPAAGTAGLRTLGTGAAQAAAGNDSRLSDARTPVAHNHAGSDINSGTVAYARLPVGTAASTVAAGDDSRLVDARLWTDTPRTGSASTSVSIDGAAAGDFDLTCTGNTTITPTGTPNGRTLVITCYASGGARTPTIASGVPMSEGITTRALVIPSGGKGRYVLRYSSLGTAGWSLDSAFLVG
jgi:hypothetical protein